jgi:hypothetical protein
MGMGVKSNNMEAKEKAEELVLKFLRIDNNTPEWFNTHIAKQCALIAVDEIISGYEFDSLEIEHKRIMDSINFWDEVKQEINNL